MDLVITTQVLENYGAHNWDGEGVCPEYWKAKGGDDYIVVDVPVGIEVDTIMPKALEHFDCEKSGNYFKEYLLGYTMEDGGFLTEFERNQMEYEKTIRFPAKRVKYEDLINKGLS